MRSCGRPRFRGAARCERRARAAPAPTSPRSRPASRSRWRPPRPRRRRAGCPPSDYLTGVSGGRRGHGRASSGPRVGCAVRVRRHALTAGDVSPEHAEVIVAVIDRLPVDAGLRDEAERVLLDQAASLNASELRKAGFDHLLEVLDPDGTARAEETALDRLERSAHLGRFLTIADDGLGGVRVRGPRHRRGRRDHRTRPARADRTAARHRPRLRRGRPRHRATTAPAPGTPSSSIPEVETEGLLPDQHGAKPRLTVTVTLDQLREGLRVRDPGHRRRPLRHRHPATRVRRRGHPRRLGSLGEVLDVGGRNAWSPPRSESPRAPRPALSVPGLPPAAGSPATPTTSGTGPTAVARHSTISSSFAGHHTLLHARGRSGSIRSTAGRSSIRHRVGTEPKDGSGLPHPLLTFPRNGGRCPRTCPCSLVVQESP